MRRLVAATSILVAAANPIVNFTSTYSDGTTLRVELIAADGSIVRTVVVPPGANELFKRYPLTVAQPPLPPNATFIATDAPTYTLLSTPSCIVNVSKIKPLAQLLSPKGDLLSGEPQPVSGEPESQCGNGHGGPIAGGCLRAWRSIQFGERIFGFGMQSFSVDHVGTTKWIATDANPSATGASHVPAPFFISSLGYGAVVNTHGYSYFDVGFALPPSPSAPGTHLLHTPDPVFDLYLLAGPTPAAVMGQFTQLYGRPAMPPRPSLGLWYHPLESSNQTAVLDTVASFKSQGAALAAVTVEPPWQTHAYACTYVWSKSTFWDVPGFLAAMAAAGTAVTLWQHAYIYNASQGLESPLWGPVFGGGLASDWITWGGATPDWTLPATRAAVWAYMNATFLDAGVAAFKLDECDGGVGQAWFFPDNATFPSGLNGSRMHNIFGMTYAETYHELFASRGQRTFLKARAGYLGTQRWPTTMYSDTYDYGQYILATANSGFIGVTWAPELRDAHSPSEFARRAQLMLFSGLASEDAWNSGFMPFPPFVSPASSAIFLRYYGARAELQPALYAAYSLAADTGLPAVRHPVLDFPADAAALGTVLDEYMLGALLVAPAPINASARYVYFPAGSAGWVDYFNPSNSTVHAPGSNASVAAPDEVLPVFQQLGSVVPLAAAAAPPLLAAGGQQQQQQQQGSVLRLRAVAPRPGGDGGALGGVPAAARIYDDDGVSTKYLPPLRESFIGHASLRAGPQSAAAPPSLSLHFEAEHVGWLPSWRTVRWEVALTPGVPRAGASLTHGCRTALGRDVPAALDASSPGMVVVEFGVAELLRAAHGAAAAAASPTEAAHALAAASVTCELAWM